VAPVRKADLRLARVALACAAFAAALAGCGGGLGDADQLFVVTADGKHRRQLTHGGAHLGPSWSPGGRRLAFSEQRCGLVSLEVADGDGEHRSTILRRRTCIGGVGVAWSPRGSAVAFLTRFEDRRFTVTIDVVAPDGSHDRRLATFNSSIVAPAGPVWAPDGAALAYSGKSAGGSFDVIVVGRQGRARRLTSGPDDEFDPRWSPSGDRILFVRKVGQGVFVLLATPVRGGRAVRLPGRWVRVQADWSPDGRFAALAAVPAERDGRYRLYVVDLATSSLRVLTRAPADVRPTWSPNGRRIAFATQDGRVATVARTGGSIQTLADLGDAEIGDLSWSPDGSRIVFAARKSPPED